MSHTAGKSESDLREDDLLTPSLKGFVLIIVFLQQEF